VVYIARTQHESDELWFKRLESSMEVTDYGLNRWNPK
jgi:hypothetical protein